MIYMKCDATEQSILKIAELSGSIELDGGKVEIYHIGLVEKILSGIASETATETV